MSYQDKIRRAQNLLEQALEEADSAGDHRTGDSVERAVAWCRSADIYAVHFLGQGADRGKRMA